MVSAQLTEVGLTCERLVADPERGYRDGGAPSNRSHQALLDYAYLGHAGVLTASHQYQPSP